MLSITDSIISSPNHAVNLTVYQGLKMFLFMLKIQLSEMADLS